MAAAADNVYFFQAPSVRFAFAQRIDDQLADELRDAGVEVVLIDEMPSAAVVVGKPMADQCGPATTVDVRPRMAVPELNDFEAVRRVATLNLDVTTMLAYISAMTNGSADWEFPEAVLTEQALWERQSPVKAVLDSVFEGDLTIGWDGHNLEIMQTPYRRQTAHLLPNGRRQLLGHYQTAGRRRRARTRRRPDAPRTGAARHRG